MSIIEMLDDLQNKARKDPSVRSRLQKTRGESEPLLAFCREAQSLGYEIYPMDLINAGEEFYASMRRSTNGGGENSPLLQYEDDFYELFFAE